MGRWLSTDPVSNKYPDLTPYSFAANSPIWLIDKKGKEPDRNQAGTINEAASQWAGLKNPTVDNILEFIQDEKNHAVRYVYTKDKGWIDLQHYFATLKYGKVAMDLLEPASGDKFLQDNVFGAGANESYYSYEDLPSNQFASEAKNLTVTKQRPTPIGDGTVIEEDYTEDKTGEDLIKSVKENFVAAKAINPEEAPNWKGIPFKDHGERKRLPEIKGQSTVYLDWGRWGKRPYTVDVYYTEDEQKQLLQTGKYIPQNHTSQTYNLSNFPAAPSSLQNGNEQKGVTHH